MGASWMLARTPSILAFRLTDSAILSKWASRSGWSQTPVTLRCVGGSLLLLPVGRKGSAVAVPLLIWGCPILAGRAAKTSTSAASCAILKRGNKARSSCPENHSMLDWAMSSAAFRDSSCLVWVLKWLIRTPAPVITEKTMAATRISCGLRFQKLHWWPWEQQEAHDFRARRRRSRFSLWRLRLSSATGRTLVSLFQLTSSTCPSSCASFSVVVVGDLCRHQDTSRQKYCVSRVYQVSAMAVAMAMITVESSKG